jgi:hypothetical protein
LILEIENIFELAIETICPEVGSCGSVDKLSRNAHAVRRLAHTALEHVANAEFATEESESYARIGFKNDDEARALGFNPEVDRWEWEIAPDGKPRRKQVMTWLKPDSQLVVKMLESWNKRYRPHQQLDVNYGGVLRLERSDERSRKTIEHKPLFDEQDDVEQRGGHLALGRPAKDSAEMDKWNAAGEFKPAPVTFVDAGGKRTERVAAPDPLLSQPQASVTIGRPGDKPVEPMTSPTQGTRDLPADGVGPLRSRPLPGGYRVR